MALLESNDTRIVERLKKMGVKLVETQRGRHQLIDKDMLEFDTAFYQRDTISQATIASIVANFSWPSCGAITVAARRRRNNSNSITYYVIDGMHRVLAARQLDMVSDLDCMVYDFEVESQRKEAVVFDQINRVRTAVKAVDRFKGVVSLGVEDAVALDRLIRDSGFDISAQPGRNVVRCIARLQACQHSNWPALRDAWRLQIAPICRDEVVHEYIVIALWYIAKATKGESLKSIWTKRFREIGYTQLIRETVSRRNARVDATLNEACASGVLKIANKGTRSSRLKLKDE